MKWFKHMTDASRDAFVVELEARFGLEGYARWWKLIEVLADQVSPNKGRWSVTYPDRVWARFLSCKPKILGTFLEHCRNQGRINWKQNGNVSEIEVCNLQRIRDNYTKDLQSTGKQLAPILRTEQKKIKAPPTPSVCTPTGGRGVVPPKIEWVVAYCEERKNGINPQEFFDHYTVSNWHRGKVKIKDWQACVRTWEQQRKNGPVQAGLLLSPAAKMAELRGKMARELMAERQGGADGVAGVGSQGADEAVLGLPPGPEGGGRAASGFGALVRVFGGCPGRDTAQGDGSTPQVQPVLPCGGGDR